MLNVLIYLEFIRGLCWFCRWKIELWFGFYIVLNLKYTKIKKLIFKYLINNIIECYVFSNLYLYHKWENIVFKNKYSILTNFLLRFVKKKSLHSTICMTILCNYTYTYFPSETFMNRNTSQRHRVQIQLQIDF